MVVKFRGFIALVQMPPLLKSGKQWQTTGSHNIKGRISLSLRKNQYYFIDQDLSGLLKPLDSPNRMTL